MTYLIHGSNGSFEIPSIEYFDIDSLLNDTNEFGVYFYLVDQIDEMHEIPQSILSKAKAYGNIYVYSLEMFNELYKNKCLNPLGKMDFKMFKNLFLQIEPNVELLKQYYVHEKMANNATIIRVAIQSLIKKYNTTDWKRISNYLQKTTGMIGFLTYSRGIGTIVLWDPAKVGDLELVEKL